MQTMQAMIPYNMALLAIATIFYSWRDMYLPFAAQNRALEHSTMDAERMDDGGSDSARAVH